MRSCRGTIAVPWHRCESLVARPQSPGPATGVRSGIRARRLLEDDAVAVGVVERHEPTPGCLLDITTDVDPPLLEHGDVGIEVARLQHGALARSRCHRPEPGHQGDRRLRAAWP